MATSAREIVRNYLAGMYEPDLIGETAQRATQLRDLGREVILSELVVATEDESFRLRVAAAVSILQFVPGRHATIRAVEVLSAALQEEDAELTVLPALLLGGFDNPPRELEPYLTALLERDDIRVQMAGALALAGFDVEHSQLLPIVNKAIESRNEYLVEFAARTLVRIGLKLPAAVAALSKLVMSKTPGVPFLALGTLAGMGPVASDALPMLLYMLGDQDAPTELRASIARNIGAIGPLDVRVTEGLLASLSSPHEDIVYCAVMGLNKQASSFPDAAIEILCQHLVSDDVARRATAARSLCEIGEEAEPAIDNLISRLTLEPDREVRHLVVEALSSIGAAAMPRLMQLLVQGDERTLQDVMQALSGMDGENIDELLRLVLTEDMPENVQGAVLWILYNMGPRAIKAVPVLIDMLGSASPAQQSSIVMAISAMGIDGQAAFPTVLDLLLSTEDPDVALWCERAIVNMSLENLQELEQAERDASQQGKSRLMRVRRQFRPFAPITWRDFKNDEALQTFAAIGEIYGELGPASIEDVHDRLKERQTRGELTRAASISPSYLRKLIEQVETHAGQMRGRELRATNRKPRQKGGLTSDGRWILESVQNYLRSKG